MIYRFMKDESTNNTVRIGDIDWDSLEAKTQTYLDKGFVHASAEEHDAQVIGGASKDPQAEEVKSE